MTKNNFFYTPKLEILSLLFLVLITFLIYSNTFDASFHLDDQPHIIDNSNIRIKELTLDNFKKIITGSFRSRPLPMLSFALNYYFGGYNLFGYHLVNILIHIITGIAIYFFIKITINSFTNYNNKFFITFCTTLLWIVHPLQTQSVTYIIQRMNSMCAMFYILSMLYYIKYRLSSKNKLYLLSCLIFALSSMACKEIAATLPFLILLYEWYFFQNLDIKWFSKHTRWIVFIIICISIYAIIIFQTPRYLPFSYDNKSFTLSQRLLTELRVVVYYIYLIINPNPSRLNIDYDFSLSYSLINPISTLFSLIIILGLIILSFYIAKKDRIISFFILWFFVNFAIESSIFPLDIIFEHRTYLPSISIILIFVLAINFFLKTNWLKIFLLIFIILVFSSWTYQRNNVWKDEVSLWQDCVKKSPDNIRALNNLGCALESLGDINGAIEHYKKALSISDDADAHYNLCNISIKKGELDNAIWHCNEAIRLDYDHTKAYCDLGVISIKKGKTIEAVLFFSEALLIEPDNIFAKMNIERILLKENKKIENYNDIPQELSKLYTKDPIINFQIGNFYYRLKNTDKAIVQYKKALLINPNFIPALNNLAKVYKYKKEYDTALSLFKKIIELKGDNADTDYNIARIYAVKNMKEEAVFWLKESVNKGFNKWNIIRTDNYLKNIRDTSYYKEIYNKK